MKTINTELIENKAFEKANEKAKKLREFYSHLRKYTTVMSIFWMNWNSISLTLQL